MYAISTTLITGGSDTGVARLAAYWFENVSWFSKSNRCVGFVPWGCVKQKDTLINKEVTFIIIRIEYKLTFNVRGYKCKPQ